MDKDENSSERQSDRTTAATQIETSRSNGHNKARTKSETKPRKRKTNSKKPLDPSIAQITISIIGLIGTIAVAWLGYQAALPEPTPVPILTATTMPSSIPSFTNIPVTSTEMPSATVALTFTSFPSPTSAVAATAIPTETITPLPQPKLIVLLQANKTSGRAPLSVKLDARESYLTDYDGQRHVCRNGPCHYTWKVYANGQQIGKSVTGSGGTFDYRFGKKGIYTVTVWICRGQDRLDCGGSGIQILAN